VVLNRNVFFLFTGEDAQSSHDFDNMGEGKLGLLVRAVLLEDESNLTTTAPATDTPTETRASPIRLRLIALKSGKIYSVAHYRIGDGGLSYELPAGEKGSIDLPEVDWQQTSKLNADDCYAIRCPVRWDRLPK